MEACLNLDEVYGPSIGPLPRDDGSTHDDWEKAPPVSHSSLAGLAAQQLATYIRNVEQRWKVGETLAGGSTIIWLVDENGLLWFAIEELVVDGVGIGVPKPELPVNGPKFAKVGHPALVGGRAARIGGELVFDSDLGTWELNNASGRYGFDASRSPFHLINVARDLKEVGIIVSPKYIRPRR